MSRSRFEPLNPFRAALPAAILLLLTTAAAAGDGLWSRPQAGGGALLSAEQAFRLVGAVREGPEIAVQWAIAPGYYLYRKRLAFEAVEPAGAKLAAPTLPKGEPHADERDGSTEVYRDSLEALVHGKAGSLPVRRLRLQWQGCADAGICYPPKSVEVDVTTAGAAP